MASRLDFSQIRSLYVGTSSSTQVDTNNLIVAGNVGIGTTAPSTRLEVASSQSNSSIRAGGLEMQSYAVNNSWYAENLYFDGSAWRLRSNGYATQIYMGAGSINFVRFATGSAGDSVTPLSTMYLTAAGNVGIGTTSPGSALHVVSGGVASQGTTGYSGMTSPGIWIGGDGTNGLIYGRNSGSWVPTYLDSSALYINSQSAGNVGIGTTSPGAKLTVYTGGASAISGTNDGIRLQVSSYNNSARNTIAWHQDSSDLNLGRFGLEWNNGASQMNFVWRDVYNSGAGVSELMRLQGNGNLGIGTTAPSFKTTISADITKSGDINPGTAQLSLEGATTPGKRMILGYDTNSNGFGFIKAGNYGVTWTPLSLQPDGGNVGIGTTVPGYKLEVYGSVMLGGTDAENYIIRLGRQANSVYMGGPNTNTINVGYDENQVYNLHLNYLGYQASTTQYRNLIVNDGRQGEIARFVGSSAFVGIGTTGPSYKLDVVGDVRITSGSLGVGVAPNATDGRIDASNDIVAYQTSDRRLKENITPIANALDKVKSLTGVEFDWKEETKHVHGYEGHDTGIIAQEVQAVMPTAVRTNDSGYLSVRYEKLIGLLVEANKELAARVEELESKLK